MTKKRKKPKSSTNKEKEFEKQIEKMENYIETFEKIQKENGQIKADVEEKINLIREDLKNQLFAQNKFGKQFEDMVDDYIYFVKLKEDLQLDIKDRGIRYESMTGNGYKTEKPNESVQNLLKVNAQMLKILQDLELKAPEEGPKVGEGDDLL